MQQKSQNIWPQLPHKVALPGERWKFSKVKSLFILKENLAAGWRLKISIFPPQLPHRAALPGEKVEILKDELAASTIPKIFIADVWEFLLGAY